ncbi:hypothetical protein D3C79_994970 [compost metagenome]
MKMQMHTDHGFKTLVRSGLKIHLLGELHQQVAHHGLEDGGQELLLVAEVVVERGSLDTHLLCKCPKRHRLVAIGGNQVHAGCVDG